MDKIGELEEFIINVPVKEFFINVTVKEKYIILGILFLLNALLSFRVWALFPYKENAYQAGMMPRDWLARKCGANKGGAIVFAALPLLFLLFEYNSEDKCWCTVVVFTGIIYLVVLLLCRWLIGKTAKQPEDGSKPPPKDKKHKLSDIFPKAQLKIVYFFTWVIAGIFYVKSMGMEPFNEWPCNIRILCVAVLLLLNSAQWFFVDFLLREGFLPVARIFDVFLLSLAPMLNSQGLRMALVCFLGSLFMWMAIPLVDMAAEKIEHFEYFQNYNECVKIMVFHAAALSASIYAAMAEPTIAYVPRYILCFGVELLCFVVYWLYKVALYKTEIAQENKIPAILILVFLELAALAVCNISTRLLFDGRAYAGPADSCGNQMPLDWVEMIYYTVISFTTVGYGDIHPTVVKGWASLIGQGLAIVSALMGLFTTSVVIAALLGGAKKDEKNA